MKSILLAAAVIALPAMAFANTIVVSPGSLNGWAFSNTDNSGTNASGAFVSGPGTAPLGTGSAQFTVNDSSSSEILYNVTSPYIGQTVSSFSDFVYDYYRASPTGTNAVTEPALQLAIYNGSTYAGRLVFEPYLAALATADATWEMADTGTTSHGWWSSHAGACTEGMTTSCSWATISGDYANDTVAGILFKAGSGWDSFVGNVDDFTISSTSAVGDTTYNFEPAVPEPASFAVLGAGLLGLLMVRKRRVRA